MLRSLCLAWLLPLFVMAQTDTLYQLDAKLIAKHLKPGVHQYLVFIQPKKAPQKTMTYVWSREVKYVTRNQEKLIEINQRWYASDTARNRFVYSLSKADNFLPVYHRASGIRGVEAYDFSAAGVKGSDSVTNNLKKGFDLAVSRPFLNWELDLEIFPLLDLKAGKRFAIQFYHPGGRVEPKLYEYKVVGEEPVEIINGVAVDCWKLRIDYTETSWAMFYISKKNREVLKMEEDFGSGIRYKVKLATPVPIR